MDQERSYSPVEICEMFDISKSTLLRWEREGVISSAKRDPRTDQRLYTQENIHEISKLRHEQLAKRYDKMSEREDLEGMARIQEELSIWKIIKGEIIGLDELAGFTMLSVKTIRQLCNIALEQYEPTSPIFCQIMRVVADQSCKLSKQSKRSRRT